MKQVSEAGQREDLPGSCSMNSMNSTGKTHEDPAAAAMTHQLLSRLSRDRRVIEYVGAESSNGVDRERIYTIQWQRRVSLGPR